MIEIKYNPHVRRLRVYGHAGSGDYGKDIVCAAVSALVLTLAQALTEITSDADVDISEGYADILCTRDSAIIDFLFATIAGGLRSVAETNAEYVNFIDVAG